MNNILQSDIFFFISSISVVFIAIAILILLIHIIKILNDISGFFKTIRSGADTISEELSLVRAKLRDKGILTGLILSLFTIMTGFVQKTKERQSRKK
ncbi:hypothetical protein KKH46_00785 [Patescibacteria group bacterium]|nr:hypothetical protein [Patescibacteria group bacterium]MBU1730484.1 hypothetical protein [Patescibacteria group bacterium]MBU1956629.1 hypothetical protein [Patescibacteria group bacterium]MBU2010240.1 hypothetical protein [Patescibacteria group bacterium]